MKDTEYDLSSIFKIYFKFNFNLSYRLTVALSVMIGLCSIEILSFISGLSLYSNLQSFLSIAFHLAAAISMLYFLFSRACSDQIWSIFATCSCLPFVTEIVTIIRICGCRRLPVWL